MPTPEAPQFRCPSCQSDKLDYIIAGPRVFRCACTACGVSFWVTLPDDQVDQRELPKRDQEHP